SRPRHVAPNEAVWHAGKAGASLSAEGQVHLVRQDRHRADDTESDHCGTPSLLARGISDDQQHECHHQQAKHHVQFVHLTSLPPEMFIETCMQNARAWQRSDMTYK